MRYETKLSDAQLFGIDRPVKLRGCDRPGCNQPGDFKAPKSRETLREYYWFCLEHVREYNQNWDYYKGMTQAEIEAEIRNDSYWQRETKPMGSWRQAEQNARDHVHKEFSEDQTENFHKKETTRQHMSSAIVEALAMLELQPPTDFTRIKAQYRALVKIHHPDANGGTSAAEEKFKELNHAFTTLRQIYET